MSWFKKHLNWTMFLAWIIALAIFLGSIPIYAQRDSAEILLYFMGFYFLVILLVSAWVLRQKGRSLWYLCLFFLREIYIIIICAMENRRTATAEVGEARLFIISKNPEGEISVYGPYNGFNQKAIDEMLDSLFAKGEQPEVFEADTEDKQQVLKLWEKSR